MKTWNDYKAHVNTVDSEAAKDIKAAEELATIITAMVDQHTALGVSQRDLAEKKLLVKLQEAEAAVEKGDGWLSLDELKAAMKE